MTSLNVQQFLNANPALVIIALFVTAVIAFLAARILLQSAGCLVHVGCAIIIIAAIILLLRLLLFQ